MTTEPLFRDDAYLKACDATITSVNERGGILLDRTVFFAAGGGQPGETGDERPPGAVAVVREGVVLHDRHDAGAAGTSA